MTSSQPEPPPQLHEKILKFLGFNWRLFWSKILLFVVMPMTTAPQLSLAPVSHPLTHMIEKLKSTKCKQTRKSKYLLLIPFSQLSPHGSNLATGNLKSTSVESRLDNHFHTCIAKGFTCLPWIVCAILTWNVENFTLESTAQSWGFIN